MVKIATPDSPEHWPSFWARDLIPNNPVLLCPLFTTILDAQKYCLSIDDARVVEITLPTDTIPDAPMPNTP